MPRPNGRDPETDPAALLGEHLRNARGLRAYGSCEPAGLGYVGWFPLAGGLLAGLPAGRVRLL
jgi:hypothetical protein